MATMSAREFNRDVSLAKRRANKGPVTITDRGKPAYVLMTIEEYLRRSDSGESLVQRLSMEDDWEVEFEPARIGLKVPEL